MHEKKILRDGIDIRKMTERVVKNRIWKLKNIERLDKKNLETSPEQANKQGRFGKFREPGVIRFLLFIYKIVRPIADPFRDYFLRPTNHEISSLKEQIEFNRKSIINIEKILKKSDDKVEMAVNELLVIKRMTELQNNEIDKNLKNFLNLIKTKEEQESKKIEFQLTNIEAALKLTAEYSYAAARRFSIKCENDGILVRGVPGYIFVPKDDIALLACMLEAGELERETRLMLQEIVEPGMTVIDVGANIGLHTLTMATALKRKGKVICFEPHATTCKLLRDTIYINGLEDVVDIYQMAVGEKKYQTPLFLGRTSGHHSLRPLDTQQDDTCESVVVSVDSLDGVVGSGVKIDLIKIDAEGGEIGVLKGAKEIIRNNPDIVIIAEFGPSHLQRWGQDIYGWFSEFTSLGLDCKKLGATPDQITSVPIHDLMKQNSSNLIFAKSGAAIWKKISQTK